jgi:hypothetical protein
MAAKVAPEPNEAFGPESSLATEALGEDSSLRQTGQAEAADVPGALAEVGLPLEATSAKEDATPKSSGGPSPKKSIGGTTTSRPDTSALEKPFNVDAAKAHLLETSCTKFNAEDNTYVQQSVWGTSIRELGQFGVGVQLYYEFLCVIGCAFFFMALMTSPLLAANDGGDLAGENVAAMKRTSLGNLGHCGKYQKFCRTAADKMNRGLYGPAGVDDNALVRDMTVVYGTMDVLAMIFFLAICLVFYKDNFMELINPTPALPPPGWKEVPSRSRPGKFSWKSPTREIYDKIPYDAYKL